MSRLCVCVRVCFSAAVSIGLCPGCLGLRARESSVKDTIRQGVKGRGGEEWKLGRGGYVCGERKKPD